MKLTKIARGVEDLAHLLPGPLTGKLLAVREGYLVHIMGTIYGTRASERSFPLPLHLVPQRVEIGVVRTFTGGGTPYINESGSLVIPAGGELNPGYMNFTYLTTTPPPRFLSNIRLRARHLVGGWAR